MQELTFEQVEEVSGGVAPLVAVGLGVAGAYAYDSMGGKEGIDKYVSNSVAAAKASASYWLGKIF